MKENYSFFIRKGIHLISGYLIIWITRYEDKALYILGCIVATVLIIDIIRLHQKRLNYFILHVLGQYFKIAERENQITGASTLWITLYLLYIIFPKEIFEAAALVVVISDAMAAIVGNIYSIYKFKNTKTIGGTITFFMSTAFIFQYSNIPLIPGLLMAIILSGIEFFWQGSLENMAIGFSSALLLSII